MSNLSYYTVYDTVLINIFVIIVKVKVKFCRYRPEQALGNRVG